MDTLEALKNDHRAIGELFDAYETAASLPEREELAQRLIEEVSVHSSVEEGIVYRIVGHRSDALRGHVAEGQQQHHQLAMTLMDLERLLASPPGSGERPQQLDAIVTALLKQVRHHVEGDVATLFRELRRVVSASELESMGVLLAYARRSARRHPPREPIRTTRHAEPLTQGGERVTVSAE